VAIPWPGACAASASPPDEFTFVRSFDQIVTTLGSRLQSLSQAQSQFAPAPRPALATCRNAPTKQYHNARLYVSDFFSSLSLYGLRRYGHLQVTDNLSRLYLSRKLKPRSEDPAPRRLSLSPSRAQQCAYRPVHLPWLRVRSGTHVTPGEPPSEQLQRHNMLEQEVPLTPKPLNLNLLPKAAPQPSDFAR